MNKLTEDDRKRLTGFLGECWHEKHEPRFPGPVGCKKCKDQNCINRTFLTPNDRQALCEKLKPRWHEFYMFATDAYVNLPEDEPADEDTGFAFWLLVEQPDRFCWLVSEWLREETVK